MTLVKLDRPRRIDPVIDDFGEPRRAASSEPYGTGGALPREPRGR